MYCIIFFLAFPYWITIVICLVLVLIILVVIFFSCKNKKSKERKLEEKNNAAIGQYAINIAQENQKKKHQQITNLDDVQEQNIPMLNNTQANSVPSLANSDQVSSFFNFFKINYYITK